MRLSFATRRVSAIDCLPTHIQTLDWLTSVHVCVRSTTDAEVSCSFELSVADWSNRIGWSINIDFCWFWQNHKCGGSIWFSTAKPNIQIITALTSAEHLWFENREVNIRYIKYLRWSARTTFSSGLCRIASNTCIATAHLLRGPSRHARMHP